ncbi:MAG TPA: hypothetical protein VKU03_01405, partial [Roseiarcus sp.]|nr:hypothetical protein [Roseiarcus sp.]
MTGEAAKPAQERDLGTSREISTSAFPRQAATAEQSAASRERVAEKTQIDTMSPPKDASRPAPAASVAEEGPVAASSAQPATAPATASSAATGPDGEGPSRGQAEHDPPYDFQYLPSPKDSSPQRPLASTPESSSTPPASSPLDIAASAKRASVDTAARRGSDFGENAPPPSPAGAESSAKSSAPRDEAAPVRPAMRYDFAQIEHEGAASLSPSPAESATDASTRLEAPPEIAAPQGQAQLASGG